MPFIVSRHPAQPLPTPDRLQQRVRLTEIHLTEANGADQLVDLEGLVAVGVQDSFAGEVGEPLAAAFLKGSDVRHGAELREGSRGSMTACGTVAAVVVGRAVLSR